MKPVKTNEEIFKRDPEEIRRILAEDKEPIDERGIIEVATCKRYETRSCGKCESCSHGQSLYSIMRYVP